MALRRDMSLDYFLNGRFPYVDVDVEKEVMSRVSNTLGLTVSHSDDGRMRMSTRGLSIYPSRPEAEDQDLNQRLFGFKDNFDLVLSFLNTGDDGLMTKVLQQIITVAADFATLSTFQGVLLSDDLSLGGCMAVMKDGDLLLSADYWSGWEVTDEILSVLSKRPPMVTLAVDDVNDV
jgi:hypothetical protein